MANVLQQQGRLTVLGIVSDIPNPVAVAAIDAIDTAYGHGDIPLGAVAHSDTDTARHGYSEVLAYVQYGGDQLTARLRKDVERAVRGGKISLAESKQLLRFYESGLDGYTYLEEP